MTTPELDLGVFLPSMGERGTTPADVVAAARHAEAVGLDSVWVVDQLVAGTGVPLLDSTVVLAAAAAATSRVRLGYGVLILPLRPVAWVAKEVASLQHVSGDRLLLGVGIGGDRHDRSWAAADVPIRERGRRTDAALRVLPDLIAGKPTRIEPPPDADPDAPTAPVELAPGATVPPIIVGGTSDAAVRRAVEHGNGWFLFPGPPDTVAEAHDRVGAAAAERGRSAPALTASIMPALRGDPDRPDHPALVRRLTDPDGMFGMPAEAVDQVLFEGSAEDLAGRLTAYAAAGASRVVATVAGGDWFRQVELLAEAGRRAG